MNKSIKTIVFWCVITISATLLWQVVRAPSNKTQTTPEISYSQFLSQVEADSVAKVRISGNIGQGIRSDGSEFRVVLPASQEQMLERLQQGKVEIWYVPGNSNANWLVNLAPLFFLAVLWFFMIRQTRLKTNARADAATANSGAPWQK